jgi:hypothetical protein
LLDGFLPDEIHVTPLIQCIETVFSALELDLVERLLQSHTWLVDFEAGDFFDGSRAAFQSNVDATTRILSDFLAIVLGSQLLLQLEEIVQAKTDEANGVNADAVLSFIKQNPKWTTEQFLTLWVQDVPAGSLRDRLCKNIEAIAELETHAEWAGYILGENLLKNTRTQFLQIYGFRLRGRYARLKIENANLKRERDDLNDEKKDLLEEYDNYAELIGRLKQQPTPLVSQSKTLVTQTEELIRLETPIQCMMYREYLEKLSEDGKHSGQTKGDAWREYWPRAVDAAETKQDLIWTGLLKGSCDYEDIKSSGKELYKRLSGPIHDPGKGAVYGKFEDWCYVKEREILPVIKAMALEKSKREIKDHEKRESWRS